MRFLIPAALCLILTACSAGERHLLVDPSDVDFDYGSSVRQARLMQSVPAKTDPLTPVENLNGKFAEKALEAFIIGADPEQSKKDQKAFLFYEQ